jgi:hypothetical protein
VILKRTEASYRMSIRNNIRGLWSGAISRDQFEGSMITTIDGGLHDAFAEGAKECGITEEDYTDVEQRAIQEAVTSEIEHLDALIDDVQTNSRANKGKLEPLYQRAELWILRYMDMRNQGKVMACSDKKFKWVLGQTEHCATCAKLAGLVHRGSQWRDYVLPQNAPNDQLECGGWRCQCSLELTNERASTRYPSVP